MAFPARRGRRPGPPSGRRHVGHHVDFAMDVREAVDAPRVYCQGDELFVDDRLPASVRDELVRLGHHVVPERNRPGYAPFARVSAVAAELGGPAAASDPPWSTA